MRDKRRVKLPRLHRLAAAVANIGIGTRNRCPSSAKGRDRRDALAAVGLARVPLALLDRLVQISVSIHPNKRRREPDQQKSGSCVGMIEISQARESP